MTTLLNFSTNATIGSYNHEDSQFISKLTPTEDFVMAGVLISTGLVGGALNVLVLAVAYSFRRLLHPMELYIVNVAINDLFIVIILYPFCIPSSLQHHWTTGSKGCEAYGFMGSILGLGSIYTLTVMAFARYLKMCVPRYSSIHKRTIVGSILGAEAAALFWAISPLVGWGRYNLEPHGTSCTVAWGDAINISYSIALLIMGLVVPVVIMVWSYAKIKHYIRSQGSNTTQWAEFRMTKMSFLMCGGFIIAWCPYAAVCLAEVLRPGIVSPRLSAAPALFAKSAGIYNPLIYFLSSNKFRAQTSNLLRRFLVRKRQSQPVRPAVNTPPVATNHVETIITGNNMVLKSFSSSSTQQYQTYAEAGGMHNTTILVPREPTASMHVDTL